MPQNRSFGRFALGLFVSPLAGAAASFILAYVFAFAAGTPAERTTSGGWHIAIFVAWWTFLICLAYTLVIGTAAYFYATHRKRLLSATFAVMAGLVVGAVPFTILFLWRETEMFSGKVYFFPALAVLCSIVTAWTFWSMALSPAAAHDAPRFA
jgi:hypothetical protein